MIVKIHHIVYETFLPTMNLKDCGVAQPTKLGACAVGLETKEGHHERRRTHANPVRAPLAV